LLQEYNAGRTPNPDILCNKYIKFDEFIKYAETTFGIREIAMGHYANTKIIKGVKYLTKAKDKNHDQTYFLCYLNQTQLNKVIFPIGGYTKDKVRKIAKENNLDT
jgi:tRNA-specific 2-thiouridylase